MMSRAQHLAVVLGLLGFSRAVSFAVMVVNEIEGLGRLLTPGYFGYAIAGYIVEPVFFAALLFGRHVLARVILGSEAEKRVHPGRALVVAGCACMGLLLLLRAATYLIGGLGRADVEALARFVSPTLLSGLAVLLGSRWIATRVTGVR